MRRKVGYGLLASCLMLGPLQADRESIVTLEGQNLTIHELAMEASRQANFEIRMEVSEENSPALPYDCEVTLENIVFAIIGYYRHRSDLELEPIWHSDAVELKLIQREVEITAVAKEETVEQNVQQSKETKKRVNLFKKLFKRFEGRDKIPDAEEAMATTKIKHLDLGEEEPLPPEDIPLEDPMDTLPTRLEVETLPKEPAVHSLDVFEDLTMDEAVESKRVKELPLTTPAGPPEAVDSMNKSDEGPMKTVGGPEAGVIHDLNEAAVDSMNKSDEGPMKTVGGPEASVIHDLNEAAVDSMNKSDEGPMKTVGGPEANVTHDLNELPDLDMTSNKAVVPRQKALPTLEGPESASIPQSTGSVEPQENVGPVEPQESVLSQPMALPDL